MKVLHRGEEERARHPMEKPSTQYNIPSVFTQRNGENREELEIGN